MLAMLYPNETFRTGGVGVLGQGERSDLWPSLAPPTSVPAEGGARLRPGRRAGFCFYTYNAPCLGASVWLLHVLKHR